jgi:hypothetical protein
MPDQKALRIEPQIQRGLSHTPAFIGWFSPNATT